MPVIYNKAVPIPRQQTIQYTPPGGVFDEFGTPVNSFGGRAAPGQVSVPGAGASGMYDPFGRRKGAFDFGQPNIDGTVWNLTSAGAPSANQPTSPVYVPNPQPQSGTGPFGQVPGPIGIPDVFGNLQKPVGNLAQLNAATSAAILNNLHGELSPDTVAAIQDAAAKFGVSSGMPGSGLARNLSLRDIGRASQDLQNLGVQQYNPFVSTVSNTQTVRPETQIGVAETNAINASAPNPAAQSSYAEELFNKYLNQVKGANPAAGTGGGAVNSIRSNSYAPPAGFGMPSGPFTPVTAYGAGRPNPWKDFPWAKRGFFDYSTYG